MKSYWQLLLFWIFARCSAFSDSGSDDRQRAVENRKRTALKVEELDTDVLRFDSYSPYVVSQGSTVKVSYNSTLCLRSQVRFWSLTKPCLVLNFRLGRYGIRYRIPVPVNVRYGILYVRIFLRKKNNTNIQHYRYSTPSKLCLAGLSSEKHSYG